MMVVPSPGGGEGLPDLHHLGRTFGMRYVLS